MKQKKLRAEADVLEALRNIAEQLVGNKTSAHEAATRSRVLRGVLVEMRAASKRERAEADDWQALAERIERLKADFAALDRDAVTDGTKG